MCSSSHVASPFACSALVYSTFSEMLTLIVEWSQGCSPTRSFPISLREGRIMSIDLALLILRITIGGLMLSAPAKHTDPILSGRAVLFIFSGGASRVRFIFLHTGER